MSSIGPFYEGWRKANSRLIDGVAKLSDDQLGLQVGSYWPIWALVGHLAGVEPSEAEALAASDRRVEVWTDVPDPFMEHFDHFQ